jgi:hypothetical protein
MQASFRNFGSAWAIGFLDLFESQKPDLEDLLVQQFVQH